MHLLAQEWLDILKDNGVAVVGLTVLSVNREIVMIITELDNYALWFLFKNLQFLFPTDIIHELNNNSQVQECICEHIR